MLTPLRKRFCVELKAIFSRRSLLFILRLNFVFNIRHCYKRWQPNWAMIECFLSCVYIDKWDSEWMYDLSPYEIDMQQWQQKETSSHWIIKTLSHCCESNDLKSAEKKSIVFVCRCLFSSLVLQIFQMCITKWWQRQFFHFNRNMSPTNMISSDSFFFTLLWPHSMLWHFSCQSILNANRVVGGITGGISWSVWQQ